MPSKVCILLKIEFMEWCIFVKVDVKLVSVVDAPCQCFFLSLLPVPTEMEKLAYFSSNWEFSEHKQYSKAYLA